MLLAITLPAIAGKHITVNNLDQALTVATNKPDPELARWLFTLELTERVSTQRLSHWQGEMPGKESLRGLAALTDASVFLKLPGGDILPTAAIDQNAQRDLLSLTSTYIEKTLSRLPNFFATQAITTFEDTPASRNGMSVSTYVPLHYADFKKATVYYRGNKEVMETHKGEVIEEDQSISPSSGLLSSGEFGPVLRTLLGDAKNGKLAWGHWEAGAASQIAVFSYSVPQAKSHYKVKVLVPWNSNAFQARPGYRGEVAIDPSTGSILRVVLRAELSEDDPVTQADLMVEYGSVEIGGKQYLCPVRSVALVRAYMRISAMGQVVDKAGDSQSPVQAGLPLQTILNDVVFEQYHLLRSESKMLTGADTEDDKNSP